MTRYLAALVPAAALVSSVAFSGGLSQPPTPMVRYRTVEVDGLDLFYREAGPAGAPVVLLLHGFPTSSHMFRNLIPELADRYHVIAPDYPGYGQSEAPPAAEFEYTFDRLSEVVEGFTQALGLTRYSLYLQDYGAPVGFRLAVRHPERVEALVIQNGNAYEEGLREFWDPIKAYWRDPTPARAEAMRGVLTLDAVRWQYLHGVRDTSRISPDTWTVDQALLARPGNPEIQLALLYDYRTNLALYPRVQEYFRTHQPPTLIVWGKNDHIFPPEGAYPYRRDLRTVEFHLLDTGHFALEEKGDEVSQLMHTFLDRYTGRGAEAAGR